MWLQRQHQACLLVPKISSKKRARKVRWKSSQKLRNREEIDRKRRIVGHHHKRRGNLRLGKEDRETSLREERRIEKKSEIL